MTGRKKSERAAFDRLADALVEDILDTPDADLLAEAQAFDDDGAALARAAFERVSTAIAKPLLRDAKASTRSRRKPSADIRSLDPKTARRWLDEFIAGNPETASKLTAAARRGELSDEDVYGTLESLQEREERSVPGRRGIEHDRR